MLSVVKYGCETSQSLLGPDLSFKNKTTKNSGLFEVPGQLLISNSKLYTVAVYIQNKAGKTLSNTK